MLKVAYAGGCWGVAAGVLVFHHKTEKETFVGLLVGAVAIWFIAFRGLTHFFGSPPIP